MASAALASAAAPAGAAPTAEARALFDEFWEDTLREAPTYATVVGDDRYNDRLEDLSAPAALRRRASAQSFARRLEAIDPAGLDDQDRVSRAVLLYRLRANARIASLLGDLPLEPGGFQHLTALTQLDGPQLEMPDLAQNTRFAVARDYDDYLKRLAALPVYLGQFTEVLRLQIASKWMPPRVVLHDLPAQFDAVADPDPERNPLFGPFRSFPPELDAPDRARLRVAGEAAIRERVAPAFAALRDFAVRTYIPAARDSIAASDLPGGTEYYAAVLQANNTTRLTPAQIHALGEREVARIEADMQAVRERAGFKGSAAEFRRYLWTDPKFFASSPQQMLATYRDIAKRVDPQLPALFRVLPRLPYGIRAMPKEQGDNTEYYSSGSPEAGRAGYFEANTNNLRRVALWQMPDLLLHEAVPGHHLQGARAQEIAGLPAFRRHAWFPAYGEGWALYAESLGDRMGMYDDPYDAFGHLAADQLRAARLVVDTGLHAMGWSREQAIGYMRDHTSESESSIASEVDRYIVWPGQATAYKLGQLRIEALRDRARASLGPRFDLRDFHNAVLDDGALPLDVLDERIDRWIEAARAGSGAGAAQGPAR